MVKIIILFLFVSFIVCLEYKLNENNFIWLYKDNKWSEFNLHISKNVGISLIDNFNYYGYLNNICFKGYSCCDKNRRLVKYFNLSNCNDNLFSTCSGMTDFTNICFDTSQCEVYNSTINIKYFLSFTNNNDIKCFKKYNVESYFFNISHSLTNNDLDYNLDEIDDKINTYFIKGNSIYNKTLNYYSFDCYFPSIINTLYYGLSVFKEFKDLIKTEKLSCSKEDNIHFSDYLDYDERKYLDLKTIYSFFNKDLMYINYDITKTININISNSYIVKLQNQGCYIFNIEENNKFFHFDIECFNDSVKYVNFSMIFKSGLKVSYIEIVDKTYSFKLNSWELPLYFVNKISGKDIKIEYKQTKRSIISDNILIGNNDYSKEPSNQFNYNFLWFISIIMFVLLSIMTLFILYKMKIIKLNFLKFKNDILQTDNEILIEQNEKIVNIENENKKLKLEVQKIMEKLNYKKDINVFSKDLKINDNENDFITINLDEKQIELIENRKKKKFKSINYKDDKKNN